MSATANINLSNFAKLALDQVMRINSSAELKIIRDNVDSLLKMRLLAGDLVPPSNEDELKIIISARKMLSDHSIELSAPESALVSCWLLFAELGIEQFSSRQVSTILRKETLRKVSNITSTMNALVSKGFITPIKRNGHPQYSLSSEGEKAAKKFLRDSTHNL